MTGIVVELQQLGKSIVDFKRYSFECMLSQLAAKVDVMWFRRNVLSEYGTKHVAGDLIAIVVLMVVFLEDEVAPGQMDKHIECFMLLV